MPALNLFWANGPLLADGAMGTYFLERFGDVVESCELANIRQPDRVRQVHQAYLEAGARLLRTNTFAAIYTVDAPLFAGLAEVTRSGYRLACECASAYANAWVAADIGPGFGLEPAEAQIAYEIMVRAFIDEGADLFMLETFADPDEVTAIAGIIKKLRPESIVIASFALSPDGLTRKGVSLQRLAAQIDASPLIDVFGLNCGVGPTHMQKLAEQLGEIQKPISLMPNSGYPRRDQVRTVYTSSADHFALMSLEMIRPNVRIIGGCCGTTPAHIQAVGELLHIRLASAGQPVAGPETAPVPETVRPALPATGRTLATQLWADNRFVEKIRQGQFVIIAEMEPPRNSDLHDLIVAARKLAAAGFDALTLADSPLARIKMDPVICAARLQREAGLPVMPHLACRDRNVNALRSLLLGAHSEGLRQILAITGDGIPESDRGFIKPVFNLNSVGLLDQIAQMNQDVFAGSPILAGAALDLGVSQPDVELKRALRKLEKGAAYLMTQPVFAPIGQSMLRELRARGIKVLLGLMPLVSYRNAHYLAEEVPGIRIPEEILSRFTPDMSREEAQAIGIEACAAVGRAMRGEIDGYYLITPFNRADIVIRLLEKLRPL